MDKQTILTGIITLASGLLGWFGGSKSKKRKEKAEADKAELDNADHIVDMWKGLVEQLQKDMKSLKAEVAEWERKFTEQAGKIRMLEKENTELHREIDKLKLQRG